MNAAMRIWYRAIRQAEPANSMKAAMARSTGIIGECLVLICCRLAYQENTFEIPLVAKM